MNSIHASLENLIKTNNGFFKSEKQAEFLLHELKKEYGNVFTATLFGNSVVLTYKFDDKGITEKTNMSIKKQSEKVVWARTGDFLSCTAKKKISALKREIKKLEKSIDDRNTAYAAGQYKGMEDLYRDRNNAAIADLKALKIALQQLENNSF